jgi:hypothetical protein
MLESMWSSSLDVARQVIEAERDITDSEARNAG